MNARALGFVHHFVAATATKPQETLLLLHGTGGNENDLLPLGQRIAPQASLLSPRGSVLENGMPRFFRRLSEGVFDIPDLIYRAQELADFIASASEVYGFAPDRVTAVGFSNGANIAAALLLLHPGVLASAILFHPMVPLIPDDLSSLTNTPIFIGAGRRDPLIPADETERLAALLRRAGAAVTVHWQEGGHVLTREEITAAGAWYAALPLPTE